MFQFYNNLKIRDKLLSAFVVVSILLISIGIKQYNIIRDLEVKKQNIIKHLSVREAFFEAKYFTRSDLHILYELYSAETEADVERWWLEHTLQVGFITDQMTILVNNAATSLSQQSNFINKITANVSEISRVFQNEMLPSFITFREHKLELIKFQNDSSNADFENQEKIKGLEIKLFGIKNQIVTKSLRIIRQIDDIKTAAGVLLTESEKEASALTTNSLRDTVIIIVLGLLFSLLIAISISQLISRPINILKNMILQLAKGELPEYNNNESLDESGSMSNALNLLIKALRDTSEFASEIELGNFASKYTPLSDHDILGNALLDMRQSLQHAKDEDNKRKIEDQRRSWSNEGLTAFNEILRQHNHDIHLLSNTLIKMLVKYLDASQGGFFVLNDIEKSNIFYELVAVYAFDRQKYLQKKIRLGEGLVGTCAAEHHTSYLTEIPNDYIEIESGLGKAIPNCLLIIPMLVESIAIGVLEITSFKRFAKHEIEFAQKIAENIASTILSIKMNERNALLLEQSQKQAEVMLQQEEKMRQNLERMRASQEETLRREDQLKEALQELTKTKDALDEKDALQLVEIMKLTEENEKKLIQISESETESRTILENNSDAVVITDEFGNITFFNLAAQKLWQYKENEIIGYNIRILFSIEHRNYFTIIDFFNKRNLTQQKGSDIEISIKMKDQSSASVALSVVEAKNGDNIRFTAFVRDLRKQLQLEEERNKLIDNIIAKEFEYAVRIDEIEDVLRKNKIDIPKHIQYEHKLIHWNEKYFTTINSVDQQHEKLVQLINQLYKSFKMGNAHNEIQNYLKELVNYTEFHFGYEERYFAEFSYENITEHLAEHQHFVDKISEFQQQMIAGKAEVSYQLMRFLKDWLLYHIQISDRKYVDCFKQNKVK